MSGAAQLTGSLLSLLTALLLALGMNIQRYSLTPSSLEDDGRIEVLGCCRMRKNALWLLGLAVYGSSNGPYMIGLSFAPLSLMTAVFASVVLFNAAFSVIINHEKLTRVKLAGCGMIVAGVALCGLFAPSDMTMYTADEVHYLIRQEPAVVYITVLLAFQFCCYTLVRRFNRRFPGYWRMKQETLDPASTDLRVSVLKHGRDAAKLRAEILASLRERQSRGKRTSDTASSLREGRASITYRRPTSWEATVVLFAHTSVLAIFESLVQLWLKALSTLGWRILDGHDDWRHEIFWVANGCLLCCAIGVCVWLRIVYSRFEVTEGLPIEYGLVTVLGLLGGLFFYEEVYQIDLTMGIMLLIGLAFIVSGILVPSFFTAGPPGSKNEALRPKLRGRLRTESMSPRQLNRMKQAAEAADLEGSRVAMPALEVVDEDDRSSIASSMELGASAAELDAAAAVAAVDAESASVSAGTRSAHDQGVVATTAMTESAEI